MSDLPLVHLYESVVARFASEAAEEVPPATPPPQAFGWKAPSKQGVTPRIVWVPGDGSNAGAIVPARHVQTEEGRILYTIEELFTVFVSSVNLANKDSDIHQYEATRLLADYWIRCARLEAGAPNLQIHSVSWVDDINEFRLGACFRIVCSIAGGIPDRPLTYVTGVAALEAAELDNTADDSAWIPEEPAA